MKNVYCEKIHLVHFSPSQDDLSVTLSNILAKLHIFLTDVLLKSIKGKQKKNFNKSFSVAGKTFLNTDRFLTDIFFIENLIFIIQCVFFNLTV